MLGPIFSATGETLVEIGDFLGSRLPSHRLCTTPLVQSSDPSNSHFPDQNARGSVWRRFFGASFQAVSFLVGLKRAPLGVQTGCFEN